MSDQMSLEAIQKVVETVTAPILQAINTQNTSFTEFKKEVYEAQKIINQSIINQQVDRKDLENHKEEQKKDLAVINGSLSENWKETRKKADQESLEGHDKRIKVLEASGNKWVGIIAAWGGVAGLISIIALIYKAFK